MTTAAKTRDPLGEPNVGATGSTVMFLLADRRLRFWPVALALGLLQGGTLAYLTAIEWSRRAVSYDFGVYAQSWWLIGHGDLDPYSSLLGAPFLHNNFELVMWPLALLAPLAGSAVALLVVQDVALVATSVVGLRWVYEHIEESAHLSRESAAAASPSQPRAAVLLAALLLAANPWCFMTAAYDFHSEALSGLFLLLAARALWRGRRRASVVWGVITAATGFVGLLGVAGVFLGELVRSRGRSRTAAVVSGVALASALVLVDLHLVGGAGLDLRTGFAYLVRPGSRPGFVQVLHGLVTRPARAVGVVLPKLPLVLVLLLPCGLVGLANPWAAGAFVLVAGPVLLDRFSVFLAAPEVFQLWPVLPLVLVGSLLLLLHPGSAGVGWLQRVSGRFRRVWLVGWTGLTLAAALAFVREIPPYWFRIDPGQAGVVRSLQHTLDKRCEVVTSAGFAGAFAAGFDSRALIWTTRDIPITRPCVVLLLAPAVGRYGTTPAQTLQFLRALESRPGVAIRLQELGITELLWRPAEVGSVLAFPSGTVIRSDAAHGTAPLTG